MNNKFHWDECWKGYWGQYMNMANGIGLGQYMNMANGIIHHKSQHHR